MRKWLLLLCALLLTGCVQTYDGPVEEQQVLSSWRTEHYYSLPVPGQTNTTMSWYTISEKYTYDIYGNQALVREYYDDTLVRENRRTFDDRGNILSVVTIDSSSWIPLPISWVEYTYDGENRRTSMTQRDRWYREQYRYEFLYEGSRTTTIYQSEDTESISWQEQVLDENGRVEKVLYSSGGEQRYFYDEAGNNIRLEKWDDALVRYREYTYDDRGRMLSSTSYGADGAIESRFSYTYEDYDYGYSMTRHNEDGTREVSEYGQDGNIVTVTYYGSGGEMLSQQRYYYDSIEVPKEE